MPVQLHQLSVLIQVNMCSYLKLFTLANRLNILEQCDFYQARLRNCEKWLSSFVMYVCTSAHLSCPYATTRLPLDGFWLNFILKPFSKICWDTSSSIEIWQEWRILYMQPFSHLWHYLAKFFLEWEMFWATVAEKIKTHILCKITFSRKSCLYEIVPKNLDEPERPQMIIQYGAWAAHAG